MSDIALEIREFWLNKVGPENWDTGSDILDAEIKAKFEDIWKQARDGELSAWMCTPENCLSLVILLDQFPRAMFRGTGEAYSTDANALAVAKRAIVLGHDLNVSEPGRLFFYTPLMHSESLMDQERCVRLMSLRLLNLGGRSLLHAKAHRDIIRQFGRFPYRNEAVNRPSTDPERAYLLAGGYELSINTQAA